MRSGYLNNQSMDTMQQLLTLLHGDIVPASQNTAMTHLVLEQVTGGHYDVLAEGQVVGHIMLSNAAPVATPWIWTLAYGFHDYRKRTRGYAATRDAALQAISESWQRE